MALEAMMTWQTAVITIGIYLLGIRLLRYRHVNRLHRRFPTRDALAEMTLDEAWEIQRHRAAMEHPDISVYATFMALPKTYGIPSISKLLAATGELGRAETASTRAADTTIIMTEVTVPHPTSFRSREGMARMNYLHDRSRKTGKISDEDLLYTLSLFVPEPLRWCERYEWRERSEVEVCASGVFWKYIGEAMGIPYTCWKSEREGWRDGSQFVRELEAWSLEDEVEEMVPAETNQAVAQHTLNILLATMPAALHGVVFDVVHAVLEPRLRRAMLFPDPSSTTVAPVNVLFDARRFILRHLMPPRPSCLRRRLFAEDGDATPSGHFGYMRDVDMPWYVRPTALNRWGPGALPRRMFGLPDPGDDGEKYSPKG